LVNLTEDEKELVREFIARKLAEKNQQKNKKTA